MKFDGASGRRPSAEARRYVYAVIATIIDNDINGDRQWFLGGLEHETDRRRVHKAAKAIMAEMIRKSKA